MRRNPKAEWELWSAVRLLAIWSDNIKMRLENAYVFHFSLVHEYDMPTDELKQKLIYTQQKLTKNHTKPVIEATRYLRMKTCHAIADNICDLYYGYSHFEWHLYPEKSLLESLVEKTAPKEKLKHQE